MDSSMEEVGPTEDTILALLDFLVDPLLPSKSFVSRKGVSPPQEESVSKQVHAVVLLYNYYHRKQYPGLEFLDFESFCKMAVSLKPSLLLYLRLMQRAELTNVDGTDKDLSLTEKDKDLSLTEKAIMSACNICRSLDASIDNPTVDGWPITRIAVFLLDDKKENCYLFHSSITQGVWSMIEKDVSVPCQNSEAVTQLRSGDKKKRVTRRLPKENQTVNETSLQQLAYAAVKQACGISQADLKTLESHVVYSIGMEKAAVHLYIMQCTISNQDMSLVPINDAMESLQGPLVGKESGGWIATPVVEYFHLLPFADKVSDWLLREGLLSTSQFPGPQKEGIKSCGSQLNVEQQPSTSNHFEAGNGVENDNCHVNEEPILNILKPIEVDREFCNGRCELKEESHLHNSPHDETANELENNGSSDQKEEQLENGSEPFLMAEEVSNGSCHLKDELPSNSPPHTETPKDADIESSHLKEDQPLKISQSFAMGEESTNGSCHLKEENILCSSAPSETAKEVEDDKTSHKKGELSETVVYRKRKRPQRNCGSNKSPGSKKRNAHRENSGEGERECSSTALLHNTDIDEAATTCSQVDGKSKSLPCENHADNEKQMVLAEQSDQTAFTRAAIVVAGEDDVLPISHEHNVERVSNNKTTDTAMSIPDERQDRALVSSNSNLEHLQKLQLTIASRKDLLSETALKALFRKRETLSQHLRSITDEIALCDRGIQTIMNGGEDDLAVKIDAIIECCNDVCLKSASEIGTQTNLQIVNPDLPLATKRKRLSEANLCCSPCQELDGICNINSWSLPTYNVSPSEGGFKASVTMKGPDFELSSESSICVSPPESRNAAASKLLDKLRSMVAES